MSTIPASPRILNQFLKRNEHPRGNWVTGTLESPQTLQPVEAIFSKINRDPPESFQRIL